MRRTPGASASRLFGRVCAVPLVLGVLFAAALPNGAVSAAEPAGPDRIATLVAAVADVNQKLQDLGAAVQAEQEGVNKALVDVQNARDAAAAAQREVEAGQRGVADANAAIADAQRRFDKFAAATYVNGPSGSYLTAADPAEALRTAAAGQALTVSSQRVMADLQRARTEQVNRESAARLAKQQADKAAADAQASQDAAVASLNQAQETFGSQQAELDRLSAERKAAQAELAAARPEPAPVTEQSATAPAAPAAPEAAGAAADPSADWDRKPAGVPAGTQASQWDLTLPAIPSAFVSGDPIAIINTILGIAQTSAELTSKMGRSFLQKLGILPTPTGYTNNGAIPRVYGREASEHAINRAMSQLGVPYSWGGGNAAGPSRGIDSGAGTVGFDCSGLVLYAFAGVGIKLPHYSGSQYDMGRKVPTSQMQRGDVVFYGPGGSQHVAIFLGNGQMLEAPYTGSHVKVSPLRTSGMTPYAVRYIEY